MAESKLHLSTSAAIEKHQSSNLRTSFHSKYWSGSYDADPRAGGILSAAGLGDR